MSRAQDPEIRALKVIVRKLATLDEDARARIVAYLLRRFATTGPAPRSES